MPKIQPELLETFCAEILTGAGMQPCDAETVAHHLADAEMKGVVSHGVNRVAYYLDLLVDLLLVRRLPPWHGNVGKRLVRAPKTYVRDSGITHALLGIRDRETLLGHPIVGASFEGYVIETLIGMAQEGTEASFYRTSAGAEIDLILDGPNNRRWAIEVKRSLSPKPRKGFHLACADVSPTDRFVVYPGSETYPVGSGVEAIPLSALCQRLQ